jgi:TolA-binding protein
MQETMMVMRVATWIFCLALVWISAGCGADQSEQLLETAQLEERQNNAAHAKQLYEDIIRLYPDSPAAKTARARLDQLKIP